MNELYRLRNYRASFSNIFSLVFDTIPAFSFKLLLLLMSCTYNVVYYLPSVTVDSSVCDAESARIQINKPWIACLAENKRKWKEQATQGWYRCENGSNGYIISINKYTFFGDIHQVLRLDESLKETYT